MFTERQLKPTHSGPRLLAGRESGKRERRGVDLPKVLGTGEQGKGERGRTGNRARDGEEDEEAAWLKVLLANGSLNLANALTVSG